MAKKNDIITVIIPVYNAEKTIERCVESIIYGEMRDISVILVDDCSSDGSWGCCLDLSNRYPNVSCYRNEKNRGVSYTRNFGLEIAKSEYVLFVDSDDWVSGKYAEKLLFAAQQNPNSLIISGFSFRNEVAGYKQDYIWEKDGKNIYHVAKKDFFKLQEKFYLQQLWNKIFRRDVISKVNIRFDENQNMGEDFQFVLDYMEAAQIESCVILNTPLYYYIRTTTTSLMSHFGIENNENEYNRLEQLLHLCGEITPEIEEHYKTVLTNIKKNYIYQAVHKKSNKKEILSFIETVMQDGKAKHHYRLQKNILIKENICQGLSWLKALPERFNGYVQRKKRDKLVEKMRAKLNLKDFTVLSQNCIGGVFYHDMRLCFTSPTINLYLSGNDFVSFVLNLDYYLSLKLRMTWGEEYPIGYLDDITIYFMHYRSCQEAEIEWEKRKKRVKHASIIVLCTDMVDFTDEVYEKWRKIPYPKILFTAKRKYANESDTVFFPEYERNGKVSDLIPSRKFYRDGILLDTVNRCKM